MEKKINIAELLKDCPKGMELDCTMFDNVIFARVDYSRKQFPIEIVVGGRHSEYLTKEGCYHDNTLLPEAKCIIFPKGKKTWEGIQIPFKDGDIIYTHTDALKCNLKSTFISIFKECSDGKCRIYAGYSINTNSFYSHHSCNVDDIIEQRLATEEEKAKLFQAIKDNGYKWNSETNTLEKLNKDKFDIANLKPFEKVLVRQNVNGKWGIDFFGFYTEGYYYTTGSCIYVQCIPYENNEHLLGKVDDCDEFYKTW